MDSDSSPVNTKGVMMADVEKLKSVRSRAQASFTKSAHTLTKQGLLEPTEILKEWNIFRINFP